jgi:hypothetical protein
LNNHAMHALRGRLLAEVERRGGFKWRDLQAPDESTAAAACRRLALLCEDLGIATSTWVALFDRLGFDVTFPPEEGQR